MFKSVELPDKIPRIYELKQSEKIQLAGNVRD